MPSRRVAAIVLPRILCEIASSEAAGPRTSHRPLGVVLVGAGAQGDRLSDKTRLDAVDARAVRAGLRAGLTLAEAHAYVAALEVRAVGLEQVQQCLARVAEVALEFGPTGSICTPDTAYVDLTGAAHLRGGEQQVASALHSRVAALHHVARVAIADGPRIAACIARHADADTTLVAAGQGHMAMAALPITALPIDEETLGWLVRVGVVRVGDLSRLPRDQVASRLGACAPQILSLINGIDPEPLVAYEPPHVVTESARWEEGVEQQSALVFVLNRLTGRVGARLQGRGQATRSLVLRVDCDKAIARLRGVDPVCTLRVDFPTPLSHADDLLRAMRARLERAALGAPAVAMTLEAPLITRAPRVQLDLSRDVNASPDALPVLLAELSAEIGPKRLGILSVQPSYRPESRSALVPVRPGLQLHHAAGHDPVLSGPGATVTRLLPSPQSLGAGPMGAGELVLCVPVALRIEQVHFDVRLEGVDWWTASPVSRDYARVWLRGAAPQSAGAAAWVFTDRSTGERWLHGWLD